MINDSNIHLFVKNNDPVSVSKSDINNNVFHKHKFLELAYVSKGNAIHHVGDQCIEIQKGNYFAIDYNEIHKFSPGSENEFEVINILFFPEFISPSLKNCRGFPDIISYASINFNYYTLKTNPTSTMYRDDSGEILALFNKCYTEYENKEANYFELIRCYLTEIIILTMRKILKNRNEICVSDKKLVNILNYISENYTKNITLKQISTDLGYTPSYLSTLFSNAMGITFREHLQTLRITLACDLLINSQKSIDEISVECGYSDIKFFRKLFKSTVHMSPSEFRSKSKNGIFY